MERPVAMTVGIDRIAESMRADRKRLTQPRAHQFPRASKELREGVSHHIGSKSLQQLSYAPHAKLHRRHQRAGITTTLPGVARVAVKDLQRCFIHHAAIYQLGWRDDDAFLKDVGGIRADGSRPQPADVRKMRPPHDERGASPTVKDWRQKNLIIGMRHRATRCITVTVPVKITLSHGLRRKAAEYRAGNVAEDRHHGADHHHTV